MKFADVSSESSSSEKKIILYDVDRKHGILDCQSWNAAFVAIFHCRSNYGSHVLYGMVFIWQLIYFTLSRIFIDLTSVCKSIELGAVNVGIFVFYGN